MMMKLLFLDLDGVMVVDDDPDRLSPVPDGPFRTEMFSKKCVEVLNELVEVTDCQIVLSSDWRLHFNLRQVWDIFKFNKVRRMPLGFTGLATSGSGWMSVQKLEEDRGKEIRQWLAQHGFFPQFHFWAAVDDMNLSPHVSRFVRTDWRKGLTTDGVFDKLVSLLNAETPT